MKGCGGDNAPTLATHWSILNQAVGLYDLSVGGISQRIRISVFLFRSFRAVVFSIPDEITRLVLRSKVEKIENKAQNGYRKFIQLLFGAVMMSNH